MWHVSRRPAQCGQTKLSGQLLPKWARSPATQAVMSLAPPLLSLWVDTKRPVDPRVPETGGGISHDRATPRAETSRKT
jgi:hypothetical protein